MDMKGDVMNGETDAALADAVEPDEVVAHSSVRASMNQGTETELQQYRPTGFWRDKTVLDDFLDRVTDCRDKVAIVSHRKGKRVPEVVTYGQLGIWVDRIALALVRRGVGRDDIISMQMPNSWQYAAVALATMRIGAVCNPLAPIYRRRELEKMLAQTQSKVLIIQDEFKGFSHAQMSVELRQSLPSLQHVIAWREMPGMLPEGVEDFEAVLLDPAGTAEPAPCEELEARRPTSSDPVTVMFTSGTTGEPKGTIHSYDSLYSAGRPLLTCLGLSRDDVCFMASTLGHLTGFLWGTVLPLGMGQKVVYQDVWDAQDCLRLSTYEGITWTLSATPFVMDLIDAQQETAIRPESWRFFVGGGAPIPSALPPRAVETLGFEMLAMWGSSEVGIIVMHNAGDPVSSVAANDGWRVPPMDLKIVDDSGEPVPVGTVGKLLVRGPSLLRGYLGKVDLFQSMFDSDGWFDTGDLGYERQDGGVRIAGRSKDIIIRGGENIPVVEVENALTTHPGIKEVVVVGYPDARLGERGCAVIIPNSDSLTLAGLQEFLEERGMARQYWPERMEVRPDFPRTPAGKVQKFLLREEFARESEARVFDDRSG